MASVSNPSTSGTAQTAAPALPFAGSDVELLNPEQVMAYVELALRNIGDQLNHWKDVVTKKQAQADSLRSVLTFFRAKGGGDQSVKNLDQKEYDSLMNTLAQHLENPQVKAIYDKCVATYGGYYDPSGNLVGKLGVPGSGASNPDMAFGASEVKDLIKQAEDGLSALNSDNEMTMMNLQTLMQQRNQVSQFASNMLNSIHETVKGVIGNVRA